MSTLEKAIGLLQKMPEHKLEAIYGYICFIDSQADKSANRSASQTDADSIEQRQKGFQGLMSFAGTLPKDFDYEYELEEARS